MNNNNMDISKLMTALSNMDKKDLEKGVSQLNNILNSNDKQKIIEQLKNNMNKQQGGINMDGDMNDILQKFNNILEDKDMSNNLKNILNNFSSSNSSNNSSESTDNNSTNTNNINTDYNNDSSEKKSNNGIPEFDINTILKIKKIMDSLNTSNKDDPRANLLLSLKPYLNETKKDKIDNYVKFLQFAKIIEVMNPLGGDEVKDE